MNIREYSFFGQATTPLVIQGIHDAGVRQPVSGASLTKAQTFAQMVAHMVQELWPSLLASGPENGGEYLAKTRIESGETRCQISIGG